MSVSRIPRRREPALTEYMMRVGDEAASLIRQYPHLAVMPAKDLLSRAMVAETAPDYGSFVRRAAFLLLAVRAQDAAEQASPFTGDDAA